MPQPYENPGASKTHRTPPWIWRDNHWELLGSGGHNCTCAQYSVYKLSGVIPGSQAVEQVSADPSDPTILAWLESHGFEAHQTIPCGNGAPDECGCGIIQMSQCAVVYQSVPDGAMIHIAVFDREFCDWGGKLSANGPIVRFAEPDDYCKNFGDTAPGEMEMVFYCKPLPGPYISDEDIFRGLRLLGVDPHEEEPVPDEFGMFPTLRKFIGHWSSWLLLIAVIAILIYLLK